MKLDEARNLKNELMQQFKTRFILFSREDAVNRIIENLVDLKQAFQYVHIKQYDEITLTDSEYRIMIYDDKIEYDYDDEDGEAVTAVFPGTLEEQVEEFTNFFNDSLDFPEDEEC